MGTLKLIRSSLLILSLCISANALAQCKKIDAEAKVAENAQLSIQSPGKSIVIEFKGVREQNFTISLFGPEMKNELHTDKTTFENLEKGKYLVVIVGKREEDGYCPLSLNVTIN